MAGNRRNQLREFLLLEFCVDDGYRLARRGGDVSGNDRQRKFRNWINSCFSPNNVPKFKRWQNRLDSCQNFDANCHSLDVNFGYFSIVNCPNRSQNRYSAFCFSFSNDFGNSSLPRCQSNWTFFCLFNGKNRTRNAFADGHCQQVGRERSLQIRP